MSNVAPGMKENIFEMSSINLAPRNALQPDTSFTFKNCAVVIILLYYQSVIKLTSFEMVLPHSGLLFVLV